MSQSKFEAGLSLRKKYLYEQYTRLYPGADTAFDQLLELLDTYYNQRSEILRARDLNSTKWLSDGKTVGMMLYVDLFSGDLNAFEKKIDYFEDLGVTLIHFMPLLKTRQGDNDGGYAVSSYQEIEPRLGNMETFIRIIKKCHDRGIRVAIDYVLNHTANDHEWAQKALEGIEPYQSYYRFYETDDIPKTFEKTLNQVFPKIAPGNFTYLDAVQKWVMTTFYPFQWDLNYDNPEVFNVVVEQMLFMMNIGIDMIRLDAIPYIWKKLGTSSRNLKEVHILMNLLREISEVFAPSTALLGEAIVTPEEIIKYFGTDSFPECHVLYNASYMVELWNALATRDARHLAMMPDWKLPRDAHWINYARCHDDIGWGLNEDNLRHLGFDPQAHKMFLIDFYYGSLKDSFAKGELYEFNAETMDARNSGTFASLCGLEKALEQKDAYQKELALKRIYLMNALFILRKGIPMIYSGDEVGRLNDYSYKLDPHKCHDSRWLHRGAFDWNMVTHPTQEQAMIFNHIKALIKLRGQIQHRQSERIVVQSNDHVLVVHQFNEKDEYLLAFNLSEDRQWLYTTDLKRNGIDGTYEECLQGKTVDLFAETILLGPLEFLVLKKIDQ